MNLFVIFHRKKVFSRQKLKFPLKVLKIKFLTRKMKMFQDITNIQNKRIKVTVHKANHRKELLRWLYEVVRDFHYSSFSFITSVVIIDSFSPLGFELKDYQLIGITALFIAAKVEEPKTHRTQEYSRVTDNTFSVGDIIAKEKEILESLNYKFNIKAPYCYIDKEYSLPKLSKCTLEQKGELFQAFLASKIEETPLINNTPMLYLETIKDIEKSVLTNKYSESAKFYIDNNPRLQNFIGDQENSII